MNEFKKKLNINEAPTEDAPVYVCGICGKPHYTIEDRMACESKCYEERKKAEEALKKQQLAKEQTKRKEEIETRYAELRQLMKNYCDDYGYLALNNASFNDSIDDLIVGANLLGWWF